MSILQRELRNQIPVMGKDSSFLTTEAWLQERRDSKVNSKESRRGWTSGKVLRTSRHWVVWEKKLPVVSSYSELSFKTQCLLIINVSSVAQLYPTREPHGLLYDRLPVHPVHFLPSQLLGEINLITYAIVPSQTQQSVLPRVVHSMKTLFLSIMSYTWSIDVFNNVLCLAAQSFVTPWL